MSRPFELVEVRVAQANFFLGRLARSSASPFEFHCYLSAFVSACRSITSVLQTVMKRVPRFESWYAAKQAELRESTFAKFFHSVRNLDQHVGTIVLGPGRIKDPRYLPEDVTYSFARPQDDPSPPPPADDVLAACHQYYDEVVQVVVDCCEEFQLPVSPQVHFTQMNYESIGESLGDALKELLGDEDAYLPELHGIQNQWLLLRELVWSTDLKARFDSLAPRQTPRSKQDDAPDA